MAMPGSFRRAASHSVETSQRLAGEGEGYCRIAERSRSISAVEAIRAIHFATLSYGTLMLDLCSSQAGTGRCFSRRKCGLNSFD